MENCRVGVGKQGRALIQVFLLRAACCGVKIGGLKLIGIIKNERAIPA